MSVCTHARARVEPASKIFEVSMQLHVAAVESKRQNENMGDKGGSGSLTKGQWHGGSTTIVAKV